MLQKRGDYLAQMSKEGTKEHQEAMTNAEDMKAAAGATRAVVRAHARAFIGADTAVCAEEAARSYAERVAALKADLARERAEMAARDEIVESDDESPTVRARWSHLSQSTDRGSRTRVGADGRTGGEHRPHRLHAGAEGAAPLPAWCRPASTSRAPTQAALERTMQEELERLAREKKQASNHLRAARLVGDPLTGARCWGVQAEEEKLSEALRALEAGTEMWKLPQHFGGEPKKTSGASGGALRASLARGCGWRELTVAGADDSETLQGRVGAVCH
jgi:hypothetical protein